jgi:hypothetical protein
VAERKLVLRTDERGRERERGQEEWFGFEIVDGEAKTSFGLKYTHIILRLTTRYS